MFHADWNSDNSGEITCIFRHDKWFDASANPCPGELGSAFLKAIARRTPEENGREMPPSS